MQRHSLSHHRQLNGPASPQQPSGPIGLPGLISLQHVWLLVFMRLDRQIGTSEKWVKS
jgi:hypothetical protein